MKYFSIIWFVFWFTLMRTYFGVGKWTENTQCKHAKQRTPKDAKYTDDCLYKEAHVDEVIAIINHNLSSPKASKAHLLHLQDPSHDWSQSGHSNAYNPKHDTCNRDNMRETFEMLTSQQLFSIAVHEMIHSLSPFEIQDRCFSDMSV